MTDEIELGLTLERTTGEYGTPPMTVDDKKDPFYKKPNTIARKIWKPCPLRCP